jgi:hypothetical protein
MHYSVVHEDSPVKQHLDFEVFIARSHGARLITTNRTDFELINRYRQIEIEVW